MAGLPASDSAVAEEYVAFDSDSDPGGKEGSADSNSQGLSFGNVEGAEPTSGLNLCEETHPAAEVQSLVANEEVDTGEMHEGAGAASATAPHEDLQSQALERPLSPENPGPSVLPDPRVIGEQLRLAKGVPAAVPDDPRITLLFELDLAP